MANLIRTLIERCKAQKDIVPLRTTFVKNLMISVNGVESITYTDGTFFRFFFNQRQVTNSLQEERFSKFVSTFFSFDELAQMLRAEESPVGITCET